MNAEKWMKTVRNDNRKKEILKCGRQLIQFSIFHAKFVTLELQNSHKANILNKFKKFLLIKKSWEI